MNFYFQEIAWLWLLVGRKTNFIIVFRCSYLRICAPHLIHIFADSSAESVDTTIRELEDSLKEGLATAGDSFSNSLAYSEVVGITCDVSDPKDVEKLANFAVKELGSIDIWVS